MPSTTILCLTALGLLAAGCGSKGVGATAGDAGAPDVGAAEVSTTGLRAFDVAVSLRSPNADAGPTSIPQTNRFTLVLDVTAKQLIVGGQGTGKVVPVTTADGKTYKTVGSFDTATPPLGSCGSTTRLTYKTLDLTLSGSTFTGHATGEAQISCGDCFFNQPFVADVAGGADATAPTLVAAGTASDPFAPLSLSTSEPLPPGAKARLVGADGFAVDLEPVMGNDPDASMLVLGFRKPEIVLGVGGGYSIELANLVDFAGLHGQTAPLRLGAFDVPPVVLSDGFESATGTKLGGGALVRAGGAAPELTPIAGTQSVYVAQSSAPFAAALGAGARFMVRLAAPASATKLSFSYRLVGAGGGAFFNCWMAVGSVGKMSGLTYGPFVQPQGPTTTPGGHPAILGEITSGSIPLPTDHGAEVVVELSAFDDSCGGLLPPPGGVLLDDLRAE